MSDAELIAAAVWLGTGFIALTCDRPRERLIDSIFAVFIAVGWASFGFHLLQRVLS